MQENLLDLVSLHGILIERCIPLLPVDQQEEYKAAYKLINDQRKAYKAEMSKIYEVEDGQNGRFYLMYRDEKGRKHRLLKNEKERYWLIQSEAEEYRVRLKAGMAS